jgi:hypothetical protein
MGLGILDRLFRPQASATPAARRAMEVEDWKPQGDPPKIGDPVRVVIGRPPSTLVEGFLISNAVYPPIMCDPDYGKRVVPFPLPNTPDVFFGSYRHDQMEKTEGENVAGEIIEQTEDGLEPGDPVLVDDKNGKPHRANFVCEFRGWRVFKYPYGGSDAKPRDEVRPLDLMPTAEQMMALREQTGLGIMELKKVFQGRALRRRLEWADSIEDLVPVIRDLVDKAYPDNDRVPDPKR